MLIYLHGFKSSPGSLKARQLGEHAGRLKIPFACPALPIGADDAMAQVNALIATSPTSPTLVGSSLGGFYATVLAERHGLRAALINPLVPARVNLDTMVGPHQNYHSGESFTFTSDHVAQLRKLDMPAITRPERYWLLVETGDEVLDYRHALERYAAVRQTIVPGGNHSFTCWTDYLDDIVRFAANR